MLNITHGLVGATIVSRPVSPFLSLPAAFFSHFLLDVIPHWDWGTKINKKSALASFLFSLADGLMTMAVVYSLFQKNHPFLPYIWLGMFTGMGQDFLDAPKTFLGLRPIFFTSSLHKLFHANEESFFWGIIPQLVIILACLALII